MRLEREGCAAWLKWYRHDLFYFDFTPNQLAILQAIDDRISHGGQKAIAAPRGDGKTALCEGAIQNAIVRGRLRYPQIIAANADAAKEIEDNIKTPFKENERLIADYPEICIPVQELSEAPQLAAGQTVNGRKTNGEWSKTATRFPTVWLDWCPKCLSSETLGEDKGPFLCLQCGHAFELWKSRASGARIRAVGVFGKIRGKRKGFQRPDFALLDDVEDEESAVSELKKNKIRRVINKAVSGLAGQGKKIATIWLCTILNPTCVSAEYTDRKQRPTYSGERYRQVVTWPESTEAKQAWSRYIELRQDGIRSETDKHGRAAEAHLVENWDLMHAGTVVSNPHRLSSENGEDGRPLELSALQSVYNFAADNGWDAVHCELQNDPQDERDISGIPKAEEIAIRYSNLPRFTLPNETQALTAHVDVGLKVLWYSVIAWWSPFSGAVVDYGTFPDQRRKFFTAQEISPTLSEAYRQAHDGQIAPDDAVVYWGISQVTSRIDARTWITVGNITHPFDKGAIDSGWSEAVVQRWIRQTPGARGKWIASKGMKEQAKGRPMFMWQKQPGQMDSHEARIVIPNGKSDRLLEFMPNTHKTRVHSMLGMPMGANGGLVLFGDRNTDHRQYAAHMTAEMRTLVSANGRSLYEYDEVPGRDNHWFDTAVGAEVVAGFCGVKDSTDASVKRKRASWVEAARKKGL